MIYSFFCLKNVLFISEVSFYQTLAPDRDLLWLFMSLKCFLHKKTKQEVRSWIPDRFYVVSLNTFCPIAFRL